MRSKLIAMLILLSNLGVAMAQAPTRATVRLAELTKHNFELGQLKLTVEKFNDGHAHWKGPNICVRVENQSDSAVVFDPQFLSLINKGTDQVNAVSGNRSDSKSPLPLRKVLPGAFIRECYSLDHWVNLPARLYYDGKELAVIAE